MTADVRALAEDVPARRWICRAIEDVWGERCSDFDRHCPTCRTWAEYDALIATRETAKAEGRREGLEEAAQTVEAFDCPWIGDDKWDPAAARIAAAIRALAKAEGKDG